MHLYISHTAWHIKTKFIEDAQKHPKFSNYLTHIFYLCLDLNISEMYLSPKLADTVLPEPKHISTSSPASFLLFLPLSDPSTHTRTSIIGCELPVWKKSPQLQRLTKKEKRKQTKKSCFPSHQALHHRRKWLPLSFLPITSGPLRHLQFPR